MSVQQRHAPDSLYVLDNLLKIDHIADFGMAGVDQILPGLVRRRKDAVAYHFFESWPSVTKTAIEALCADGIRTQSDTASTLFVGKKSRAKFYFGDGKRVLRGH